MSISEMLSEMPSKQEVITPKEKPIEQIREELIESMGGIAENVNTDLQVKDFINKTCAISIEHYGLSASELDTYYKEIKKRERYLISRSKQKSEKEVTDEEHQEWLAEKAETKSKKSDLVEMTTTLLLHKGLGPDYIVVRTCEGDDYRGIDNIIVHKPSGTVICAFDDFHGRAGGEGEQKKLNYIKTASKNGGVTIKHGFTVIDGILVKKEIKNVPIFYIAFDITEFNKALQSLDTKNLNSLSLSEEQYFNKMIHAFETQLPIIEHQAKGGNHTEIFQKNLKKFKELLNTMKRPDQDVGQEGSYMAAA